MKKNYSMRIASMLLVLVLLTTCVISGTFAKYATSGNGNDSARVAKWGVEIAYSSDEITAHTGETTQDIRISASEELLAPGAHGELGKIVITGTPEVALNITYTATVEIKGDWTYTPVGGAASLYFPLDIKVNGTPVDLSSCVDIADVADAIKDAIEAEDNGTTVVAPDTTLDGNYDVEVTWEWAFDGEDVKDTALGNNAAKPGAEALSISVTIDCLVEQVDE